MKRVCLEALVVLALGMLCAFAVNAISPRGLKVTRNYFPEAKPALLIQGTTTNGANAAPATGATAAPDPKIAENVRQIESLGFQVIDTSQASELSRDPRAELGQVVFIDARDTRHFEEGHIPGAYQFDHYRPEPFLPVILPLSQTAEVIVIYCKGGDCEDSKFAALFLRDSAGTPADRIRVYAGGIDEWKAAKLPVEVGQRGSGVLQ